MASDERHYILVRLSDAANMLDGVEICKAFEDRDEVERAILVYRGSSHIDRGMDYVGEFYSTSQAVERLFE